MLPGFGLHSLWQGENQTPIPETWAPERRTVLFILYLSELSRRMSQSGVGSRLLSGELVNILLFADDIIILDKMASDFEILKSILECWCKDFNMKVSPGKTKIIMPSTDLACFLTDLLLRDSDCLDLVSQYKYLGVVRHSSPLSTSQVKGKSMVERAQSQKCDPEDLPISLLTGLRWHQ